MIRGTDPTGPTGPTADRAIDWDFAVETAARLTPAGPKVSRDEAAAIVADLRAAAAFAREPVARTTGLSEPTERSEPTGPAGSAGSGGSAGLGAPAAVVVDRPGWIAANAASMRALIAPVLERIAANAAGPHTPSGAVAIGAKITGAETGSLLGFMSTKVLGQYDLAPGGNPTLMLVAPNLVAAERQMQVDPTAFRRWVAMHEETHRLQFTAVPWLRQHMIDASRELAIDLAPNAEELAARVSAIARRLPDAFAPGSLGLADVFLDEPQRDRVAAITAIMALLEGHADVMMDEVGPQVIPGVETIRARFTHRRRSLHQFERLLRRLIGMEAKMRQYSDGAGFVRAVIGRVGLERFNDVFISPETLPTAGEIADPGAWIARVHGAIGGTAGATSGAGPLP